MKRRGSVLEDMLDVNAKATCQYNNLYLTGNKTGRAWILSLFGIRRLKAFTWLPGHDEQQPIIVDLTKRSAQMFTGFDFDHQLYLMPTWEGLRDA